MFDSNRLAVSCDGVPSRSKNSVLVALVGFALALVAMFAIPATANATFGISGFSYAQSTLQASGHPNTTITFTRTGSESEDLRDVLLDLPTGVFPNPENGNPKCTVTQFNTDKCPTTSQVGTLSVDLKAASLLNQTAPGTIYMITPDPTNVATLGMIIRPKKICILFIFCATPNKQYMKTGITVRSYDDSGLRTYTPGTASTSSMALSAIVQAGSLKLDITVNKLTLNFQGKYNSTNSGKAFWIQSGLCAPATAKVRITSYQNVSRDASSTYTPTGCASVPFNPSIAFAPASTQAGIAPSSVTFTLNVPDPELAIENGLPKSVDIDFPNGSGLDLNALTGITACTEAQLNTASCPASSIMGTATATSKELPNVTNPAVPGLTGNVYAMGIGNQIPVGVELKGPRTTLIVFRGVMSTRGDANVGTGRVYALFDKIPQLPYRQFTMTITKPVYKNPDACAAQTVSANIIAFAAKTVTRTSNYTTTNCAPAPDTTITSGPPSTTTNRQPAFTFTSTIAGSTFQCKIDSGAYSLCSSPFAPASALADGAHTFSVYASNGLTPDPSPATYNFTVATGSAYAITATATPTTYQAAAHPDISSTVNVTGGQPKSFSVKMPTGLNASLTAVPRCTVANAAAGTCSAASKVGTLQITANTFSGAVSGVGDVFLTDAPTGADAGGAAVKVPLGGLGDFIAQGGAFVINNGNNQNVEIRDFPTSVGGTDITITQLVMNLSGANKFLTNSSNCAATDGFVANSTAFDGTAAAPVNVAYQATGCSTVPFGPTQNLALSSSASGQTTGITATVDIPTDNSTIKAMRVLLPPSLGPNYPGFGTATDMCNTSSAPSPTSVFNPASCPTQSIVGTMDITTPLLPFVLHGDVYLINKSPLPWFGVKFDSPGISVRMIGVTSLPQVDSSCDPTTDPSGFCQSQIATNFTNLPDVPATHVVFDLNHADRTGVSGPIPGKLLVVASPGDPTCVAGSARATITPWTGTTPVTLTQTISPTGC